MILYRPVGLEELRLVYRTGMKRFPPRLPEQPIFYPVLNEGYAIQIARDWNTKSGALVGYVTEFAVEDAYARTFRVEQAGARQHRELWVPAEVMEEFNDHIQDRIRVIGAYFSPQFEGAEPQASSLRGKSATAQLEALEAIHRYNMMDFHGEITANHEVVFTNYPFWADLASREQATSGDKHETLLAAIRSAWESAFPEIPLGVQAPRTSESR